MTEFIQGILVFSVAFIVTFLMVPVSKRIALKIGAIDYPSDGRINTKPIPRCGGIALYCGLLAAVLVMFIGTSFFNWEMLNLYFLQEVNYPLFFAGVTLIFAVGLVDDIVQLSPAKKLVGQVLAAIVVVFAGVSISVIKSIAGTAFINLGWLDYPISVVFLVVFVNIINLIDGLDGLAAGIVAIIALSLLYMVLQRGNMTLAFACVALIAICLAFLFYNFAPASIFMGDSGSYLLGLILGVIAISGVMRTQSLMVSLVPIVIAGIPILDTLSAVIRRIRGHEPVQKRDLEHIHHRLVGVGLKQREAVFILYTCSLVLAVIGIFVSNVSREVSLIILIALAVIVSFAIWRFGLFRPVLKHYYDGKERRDPKRDESGSAQEVNTNCNENTTENKIDNSDG